MTSTFGGLNRATTALWASQRGLDVAGQNISNVNTDGYSRQRVELSAINGPITPARFSVSDGIGAGVDSGTVTRIRDAFLEARGRLETARTAQLTVESDALGQIEQAFREPGTTGIQSMMSSVWTGWSAVANTPSESGARQQVLERMNTVAAGIRTTAATMDQQWQNSRDSLQALTGDVNANTTQIAQLNDAIRRGNLAGTSVNELTDQRDKLVMTVAGQIGATAMAGELGTVNLSVRGSTLVQGSMAVKVAVAGTTSLDGVAGDPPRVVTADGGSTLDVGGTALGQVNVLNTTIPTYRTALDSLASSLATAVNTQHAAGFDSAGVAGGDVFGTTSGSGPITAANIAVVITDPSKIAAAGAAPGGGTTVNGNNADAMYQLSQQPTGVDAAYRQMIVGLGVESSVATNNLSVQTVVKDQVDSSRESVSGVNLDEEMTTMMQFQHSYSAAARLVTAIDEMLNTLINGTGLVGRG